MSSKRFKIEVSDWTKINSDTARFILEEAKTYFRYLSDVSDKITARAFTILSILIPIASALIYYLVSQKLPSSTLNAPLQQLVYPVVTFLIIVLCMLIKLIFPRMAMPLGRDPQELCIPEFLGIDYDDKLANLSIVLNEIENVKSKIDYTEKQNRQRLTLLKACITILALFFVGCVCKLLTP